MVSLTGTTTTKSPSSVYDDIRKRLRPCKRKCARESLTVTQAGRAAEELVVIICGTCQNATPVLSVEKAEERWNKEFGYGDDLRRDPTAAS